jgi:heme/copper-type cytochrome/quinol oxidase subunit 4
MNGKTRGQRLGFVAASLLTLILLVLMVALPSFSAVKNIAVIMSAGAKLQDVQLSELMKLCKGTQKTWVDGKSFTLVMTDPGAPEMHPAIQKLFGMSAIDLKVALAKLNESRTLIKIVDNDADLLRTVEATPGAVGIVDVYAINSSVKVLRVDGKLPFDVGYALKGN